MAAINRQEIEEALKRLGELASAQGYKIQLMLIGGAVMVLLFDERLATRDVDAAIQAPSDTFKVRDEIDIADARRLLKEIPGTREQVWQMLSPHLVKGSELKAQYAFKDLWGTIHGND